MPVTSVWILGQGTHLALGLADWLACFAVGLFGFVEADSLPDLEVVAILLPLSLPSTEMQACATMPSKMHVFLEMTLNHMETRISRLMLVISGVDSSEETYSPS